MTRRPRDEPPPPHPPGAAVAVTDVMPRSAAKMDGPLGVVLRCVDAAAEPKAFRLTSGKCVIGSAPDCDIVIADPTVSRRHLELELAPEGVLVRDLGSRNGTFYLGQRVEGMVLAPGSRISVGRPSVLIGADTEGLDAKIPFPVTEYAGILGHSPAMQRLFAALIRLEGSLVPILVEGESGVGKELVARALHARSKVAKAPFVAVNCGAFSRELIASELFGHKKGAFTGASEARRGAFESADGGTLFLDEIGELPLDVQPMLLRALEEGEIRPVGGDSVRKVRVRVVAATNRDLLAEVGAGQYREDLFYRLAIVRLNVPALRDRVEDVEVLANRFAKEAGLTGLPPEVLPRLHARVWPGNVRELRNAVYAYAALGELPEVLSRRSDKLDMVFSELLDMSQPYATLKDAMIERFTVVYLRALLAQTHGNQSAAARIAGLDRTHLGRMLAKYGTGHRS